MEGERAARELKLTIKNMESLPLNSRRYLPQRSCRSTDYLREKTLSKVRNRLPRPACPRRCSVGADRLPCSSDASQIALHSTNALISDSPPITRGTL
jgi:hypothetical protein